MGSLVLQNIRKSYGTTLILPGINLYVPNGELLVLLGPSGSGKSTILNVIAGLESPDGGDVLIDGKRMNDVPPERRDVAMVFQSIALYPTKSIFDNIAFPLRLKRLPPAEIDERVRSVASLMGIAKHLSKRPHQLSGGERQRVAIARAIVREPRMFLFDEPLSSLDAKLRVEMRTELKALHERLGTTFVYVTHDQEEALSIADRIVLLERGAIQQTATPREIYYNPANRFVAEFVGTPPINLFHGVVEKNGGDAVFLGEGLRAPVHEPDIALGREVILGVRPEEFVICSANTPNAVEVELVVEEPLGRETHLTFTLCGTEKQAKVVQLGESGLTPGDKAHVTIAPHAQVQLFDPQTGRSLRWIKGGEEVAS